MIDFLFEDSLDDGTMTFRCELILRPRGTISLILEGCSEVNKLVWVYLPRLDLALYVGRVESVGYQERGKVVT